MVRGSRDVYKWHVLASLGNIPPFRPLRDDGSAWADDNTQALSKLLP